jgi:hypothetical protein
MNKHILIGALLFTTTVAAGYLAKRRIDAIRAERLNEELLEEESR